MKKKEEDWKDDEALLLKLINKYGWLIQGEQRGKIFTVLEYAMTTKMIRKQMKLLYDEKNITQRSVSQIMNDLLEEGLVEQVYDNHRNGYGKVYRVTKLGRQLQEMITNNGLRGIW